MSLFPFTVNTTEAIKKLLYADLNTQALIILYSAIDTMAWINKPDGDVNRNDFCIWVDLYMQPQQSLGCTAMDLYSARCGLLHSHATESKLIRKGEAYELWYAGTQETLERMQRIAVSKNVAVKVILVSMLIAIFLDACSKFEDELNINPQKRAAAEDRMKKWITFVPSSQLE